MPESRPPPPGAASGEANARGSESPVRQRAARLQAASTENTPHNNACGEGGRGRSGDKAQDGEKGGDTERDAKSQQMAQSWRSGGGAGGEGEKIRVQSRHVKQH